MHPEEAEQARPAISWAQVFASALAAVTSAVLLSTLGVAGTLIGAAVGSVAATVGAALYKHWLEVSRHQVAAQAAALRRVTQAREHVGRAAKAIDDGGPTPDATLRRADRALGRAEDALDEDATAPDETTQIDLLSDDEDESRIRWGRVALITLVVFVVAMVAITAFELLTGRAVSSYTGGSDHSTGSTLGVGAGKTPSPTPSEQPSTTPTPSSQPSPRASTTPSPSSQPSPSESTVPAPTLTPTQSASPASPG
jgi:hypothetical protein